MMMMLMVVMISGFFTIKDLAFSLNRQLLRMGRSPCCEVDANVKKGPWSEEEDKKLMDYIEKNGAGNWRHLPKRAGLNRCGKSCRLRWTNYLRPDIKRGTFTEEEERLIIHLHSILGNKWSAIAAQLQGRTDNEIKNYWNTHIRKKLLIMGIDPVTHMPRTDLNLLANLPNLIAAASNFNNFAPNPLISANIDQLPNLQLLQNLIQTITNGSTPSYLDGMGQLASLPFAHQNLNPTNSGSNILMNGNDHLVAPLNNGSISTATFMNTPTSNSSPSLASASPEHLSVDQVSDDPWSGLTLDDLDGDLGWKEILDQISWSNPLEQEIKISKK